jgi:hypothetical protein
MLLGAQQSAAAAVTHCLLEQVSSDVQFGALAYGAGEPHDGHCFDRRYIGGVEVFAVDDVCLRDASLRAVRAGDRDMDLRRVHVARRTG